MARGTLVKVLRSSAFCTTCRSKPISTSCISSTPLREPMAAAAAACASTWPALLSALPWQIFARVDAEPRQIA